MRENKGEEGEWKCCWAEGRTRKWNWHIFHRVYIFFSSKGCCRSIPVPVPLLIIPIIMAHYENVINNTEDIVVAISHMVVGLCSVTILPLASTYVCQRRAAMTSSSSAHLALPTESHTLGWGGAGYSSWLLAWLNFLCSIRSDWGQNVNRRLGWPIKLWCSWESEGRGGGRRHKTRIICACVLYQHKQNVVMHIWAGSLCIFISNKSTCSHARTCTWIDTMTCKRTLGHSQSNESSWLGVRLYGKQFLQREPPC